MGLGDVEFPVVGVGVGTVGVAVAVFCGSVVGVSVIFSVGVGLGVGVPAVQVTRQAVFRVLMQASHQQGFSSQVIVPG